MTAAHAFRSHSHARCLTSVLRRSVTRAVCRPEESNKIFFLVHRAVGAFQTRADPREIALQHSVRPACAYEICMS